MLAKKYRVTKKKEIEAIMKNGESFFTKFFVVKYLKTDENISRFGFVVSKKVAKSAVKRNVLKRRMREVVRKQWKQIRPGYATIILFSKNAAPEGTLIGSAELESALLFSLKKSKLGL
jgi:ribonuclease P protein component